MGYVERMVDGCMSKALYKARMDWKCKKGRPGNRWIDEVEADLPRTGIGVS